MTKEEIRASRIELGMTQKQLAEKLRVAGEATVRSWESGRRPVSGPAAVAIEMMLERQEDARDAGREAALRSV